MGASKAAAFYHQPSDPDRNDVGSSSSAPLLDDVDYPPDEELPEYSSEPPVFSERPAPVGRVSASDNGVDLGYYKPPTELPFSTYNSDCSECYTLFPDYSTDASTLYNMINEQAGFAPTYMVELLGTHMEQRSNSSKDNKDQVTDFHIRLDLTPYLYGARRDTHDARLVLPSNILGYRGTRFQSLKPDVDVDVGYDNPTERLNAELLAWGKRFVKDKSSVKSFTLTRLVTNHDTAKLKQLLHVCIQETGYRGQLTVKFSFQYKKLTVYSPGLINTWRKTAWIQFIIFISFLWIITWPLLIFLTARYEVVKADYPYASKKPGAGADDSYGRVPTVMSEVDWFRRWESAIRRAALSRMNSGSGCLTEDYRSQIEEADKRARQRENMRTGEVLSSVGSPFVDSTINYLAQGMRLASRYQNAREWGADS